MDAYANCCDFWRNSNASVKKFRICLKKAICKYPYLKFLPDYKRHYMDKETLIVLILRPTFKITGHFFALQTRRTDL
jgi:hypothetical protein